MRTTHALVTVLLLTAIVVVPIGAEQDPDAANRSPYPIDGPTTFRVGGREVTIVPFEFPGTILTKVYTDVESEFPVLYQGILANSEVFVQRGVPITVPSGSLVAFYRSGALKETDALAEDTTFPVSGGSVVLAANQLPSDPLCFFEDGTVKSAMLAEDAVLTVDGRPVPCHGEVVFGETGAVEACVVRSGAVIVFRGDEVELEPSSLLHYYPGGGIRRFNPLQQMTVTIGNQDVVLKPHCFVMLDESGSVSGCTPAQSTAFPVRGMQVEVLPELTFLYEDGSLSSGRLLHDTAINVGDQEILFASGREISFRSDGSVWAGTPAEPVTLRYHGGEVTVDSSTCIYFDRHGTVTEMH